MQRRAATLIFGGVLAFVAAAAGTESFWRPGGPQAAPPNGRDGDAAFSAGHTEMAEVFATEGDYQSIQVRRTSSDGHENVMSLRAGDRILAGDRITVGPDARLELYLGMNARALALPNSSFAMIADELRTENGVTATRRHLTLSKGMLRTRVRLNVKKPEPVIIHFLEAALEIGNPTQNVLGGTDGVVSVSDNPATSKVVLFRGNAILRTRVLAGDGGLSATLTTGQTVDITTNDAENSIVKSLNDKDLKASQQSVAFLVDRVATHDSIAPTRVDTQTGP